MIAGGTVLGIIPARGGSKGVPRKNVRVLAGKPLLQWTVEAARAARSIDRLILSTDDDEIAELGTSLGVDVPFRRSASASSDVASAADVVVHALASVGERYDYLVYLQPTSPLREADDIDRCLERLVALQADSCVTITETPVRPEWLFYLDDRDRLAPVLGRVDTRPRQALSPCYLLNGAVFAIRTAVFERTRTFVVEGTVGYLMPAERSLDVDEPADLDRARRLLNRAGRSRLRVDD
jgi:N-acylneuraminate cytidylyltransferase